jgi:hypothetical protein
MAMQPERNVFLRPVFRGKRFDGHTMPVEVLGELSAYQKLIAAIARAMFKKRHPGRQRVPKGFEDGFFLAVRQLEEGSAVPVLERHTTTPQPARLFPAGDGDLFEAARELLGQTIAAAQKGKGIPAEFPRDVLPLFNTFGRSLRDDESVELVSPTGTSAPVYDRHVRKRLILLRDNTYEDKADITGRVVQFDSERESFQLAVEGGQRISGMLTEQSLPLIRFAVGQDDLLVRVIGNGLYNAHDELVRFEDIEEVSLSEDEDRVKELDIDARIQNLAELEAGWLDGEGIALDRDGLIRFSRVLKSAVESEGLSRPFLYPTPEGGVQAEWSFADAEVSAEIDLDAQTGALYGLHLRSKAEREEQIDLDAPDAAQRLASFVTSFAPVITGENHG